MADRLIRVLGACLAFGSSAVGAQTAIADPTRPPPGILAPAPEAGEASGPVLQSVLLPKKGRPLAVIANTVKGKGIRFMENRSEWHNRMPNAAEQEEAWRDLETSCLSH